MDEISKMQTPWDSDKILMVDIGCAERGCMGVETSWAGGGSPECRAMQEYKEWQGLTEEEMQAVIDAQPLVSSINVYFKAIEAKLKEKNT